MTVEILLSWVSTLAETDDVRLEVSARPWQKTNHNKQRIVSTEVREPRNEKG